MVPAMTTARWNEFNCAFFHDLACRIAPSKLGTPTMLAEFPVDLCDEWNNLLFFYWWKRRISKYFTMMCIAVCIVWFNVFRETMFFFTANNMKRTLALWCRTENCCTFLVTNITNRWFEFFHQNLTVFEHFNNRYLNRFWQQQLKTKSNINLTLIHNAKISSFSLFHIFNPFVSNSNIVIRMRYFHRKCACLERLPP